MGRRAGVADARLGAEEQDRYPATVRRFLGRVTS